MSNIFCALCTSERGPFRKRALGRNDAIVDVCQECDETHPRSGRYSFADGTPSRRTNTNGNKRTPSR